MMYSHIKLIEKYFAENQNHIQQLVELGNGNVVIGGSCALHLHGLQVSAPHDLDLIIYRPTPAQERYIDLYFVTSADYPEDEKHDAPHSFNVSDQLDKTLNVIIEQDNIPQYTLLCQFFNIVLPVNAINSIVEAISYYRTIRRKDVTKLQFLKNNNFNYGD